MVRGAAPDTLVLADGDHGYGNAMNVQRTVRAYGQTGAAAILIEDKITPRALTAAGKPCLPRDEARMKIRAAVEAAKESGILVMARTDCRPTQGIDEARGADRDVSSRKAPTSCSSTLPENEDEIRRAVAAAKGRPSFAVLSPGAPRETPTQGRAEELGLKIGDLPDRPAVSSPGGDQGRAGRPARRRGGSRHGSDAARVSRRTGVWRLRQRGDQIRALGTAEPGLSTPKQDRKNGHEGSDHPCGAATCGSSEAELPPMGPARGQGPHPQRRHLRLRPALLPAWRLRHRPHPGAADPRATRSPAR